MEESRPSSDSLSSACLGQLLVMQAVVGSLPDEKSIFSFVSKGLTDIPGVVEARHSSSPGEITGKEHVRFPIHVGDAGYGELLIRVTDRSAFLPYEPYLRNFSLMLAVILRERDLRHINESHAAELEKRIEERTLALTEEITVRNQAEKALRESEARFRATFEQAAMGIAVAAADGRWLKVNDKLCDIVGYPREELLEKTFQDITHPDDLETDLGYVRKVLAGEINTFSMEKRYFRKDGSIVWTNLTVSLVRDDPGQPKYFIGVIEDITERKKAEEVLRESEERFRVLSEQSPLGMSLIDRQGRYEYVNPAFVSIFGYTLNDVPTGADWFRAAFPDPDVRTEVIRAWKEDLASSSFGEARPRTFEVTCKDGARKWILFRPVSLSRDRQFVIYEDVTRQRELQEQLQQAMKMEAVGRLAGGVAHDFNNLLTAIIGNVTLAMMKLSPSEQVSGMLVEAKKAAERSARLTQQLLAFSRKQIIAPKVLYLNDMLAGLAPMLTRLIGEQVELKTILSGGLGPVKVDPGQLDQILMNLVINARDAMPDGGKVIIGTANADLDADYCARNPDAVPGQFVMLSVSDTGHGMSKEVMKHIFEPFFTTKPKGTGTGLGLSTIYGAVKQAGGSIEVYSEEGNGTTFKIYFPRVKGEVLKPESDNGPADLPEGSETVLVVEDEDIVRGLCIKLLEQLGYTVLQASNGDEAIALATGYGERIDLLMTDVVMPGMNVRELANRLTRIHPEIRVLFTSGYTDDAIVHHGVLDEGVSFVGKPYSLSVLAKKVREVLDKP